MGSVSDSKINQLKSIKEASTFDLVFEKKIIWLMKKIILEQNDRIEQLELKFSEIKGEVEKD